MNVEKKSTRIVARVVHYNANEIYSTNSFSTKMNVRVVYTNRPETEFVRFSRKIATDGKRRVDFDVKVPTVVYLYTFRLFLTNGRA